MRLLHYPPQPASPLEGVEGIGAHTDYEVTRSNYLEHNPVLNHNNVPALQVMNTSGDWIDAVPIPGCLVVKYGRACFTSWLQ
ncbi:hypothetical protein J3R82DRAFT_9759 [Butyriboletus roseoflavus]|nr:hypothetical protein J3R82DRAFT_9759 [Butyriboletus roseoflavus]